MEFIDVVKMRRSVRKFKETQISDKIIFEMLESARLAPSPGNSQGHYFGIVKDKTIKTQLAEAAGQQMWIATAPEDDFGVHINNLRFGEKFIEYLCKYPNRKECMKLFENAIPLIPAEHIFLTAVSH